MNPEILKKIIFNETGGYPERVYIRDDLHTKYGVSFENNADRLKDFGITNGPDIAKLTEDQAHIILTGDYITPSKAELLPDDLAYTHADFFVNKYSAASKCLQELINDVQGSSLQIDGVIGPKTQNMLRMALMEHHHKWLCDMYNLKRIKFYHDKIQSKRIFLPDGKERIEWLNYCLDLYSSWLRRCTRLK